MPKPSRRARQSELTKRKKQPSQAHRPGAPLGDTASPPTPAEAAVDGTRPDQDAATMTPLPSAAPLAQPVAPPRPGPLHPPQTPVFRQPAFRSASRAGMPESATRDAPSTGARRPIPQNPYWASDIRTIGIVTIVLTLALIALKVAV